MLIVFPVKLSFDSGNESPRHELKGRVRRKVVCVHKRLEHGNRPCTQGELELVCDARMVVCIIVLCDQYVGAHNCF
jgi:hypothetical protein